MFTASDTGPTKWKSVSVESAESHHAIVDALLERRPEDAGHEMRRHLEKVSQLMLANRLAQTTAKTTIAVRKPGPAKPKPKPKMGRNARI